MRRSTFDQIVDELEKIADNECKCEEDGIEICKACVASKTLNRISADVFDSLEEINAL